ncbi:putative phage associated protein [Neisseria meningitidis 992008]|nr:putative phage associated protein [Neisseria meningitidis 992008]
MAVCRPVAVIPANAGIQQHNAAGLYRKKPKPHRPSFPQKRESKNATQQEFIGKTETPTDRHSRKSGNPATEKPQESISKNRNPHRRHSRKSGNPDPSARKLTE